MRLIRSVSAHFRIRKFRIRKLLLQSLSLKHFNHQRTGERLYTQTKTTVKNHSLYKTQRTPFPQALVTVTSVFNNSYSFSWALKYFSLFATRPFLFCVISGCSAISFAQFSCASGESTLSPLMRASCKPFESPSTSSSSTALTVLSTKRLNDTGKDMIIIFIRKENRVTCLGSMLARLP